MSVVNLPQNIPSKAWVIVAFAIFILALCIGLSFVVGNSSINTKMAEVEDKVEQMEAEIIEETKK